MKCAVALLWLVASSAGWGTVPGVKTQPTEAIPYGSRLTWEDLVRLAIKNNPQLQASRESILNSEAVKMGAYNTLYPHISASLNASRSYSYSGLYASSNYSNEYSEELTLSQDLFDGFSTKGNIERARAELRLTFANFNGVKAIVSFNLKSAFAQLLYAQQLVDLDRGVIEIRDSNAKLVKVLYDGGTEDKGAWLLSQANLDEAKNDYGQAIRTVELSEFQVCVVAGVDIPKPVVALGELKTGEVPPQPDFRKLAVLTPAYYQVRAQADAAAAGIVLAESNWYPSISAGADVGQHGDHFPLRNQGWSAGVSASYSIFDGGRTYFDVKAATASLRESLASLQSGTDQASLVLAETFKTLVDTQYNVGIQHELLDATSLRYKIEEARYRNGLDSFQDFDTITESYVNQQRSYLASLRDAVIAEANWEEAKGQGAIP